MTTSRSRDENRVTESELDVDPIVANLLRQIDESDPGSQKQIDQLVSQLTPEQQTQFNTANQCLELLGQFRNARRPDSTIAPCDETLVTEYEKPGTILKTDQTFGRYTIIRQCGEGGFSRVYLAHDNALDRDVALKIPRTDQALSQDSITRFQREAKAVAILSHPAIIPVFDSGNVNGIFYIAFAFCDAISLAQFANENDLECDSAAQIIGQLAEAIEHAHRNGVVHRDLKPGNVLIEHSPDNDKPLVSRVRITDFGLARQLDDEQHRLTMTGTLVGTPAYMSPEQIGNGHPIGKLTDVYSLGVMLYELLVGTVPHRKSSYASTLHAITSRPISTLPDNGKRIPKDLEAICLKCLAHDPAERYPSAFALSDDLNRFINGQPILARKLGIVGQVKRWAKRNPLLATSFSVTALILLTGLSATLWLWTKAESNRIAAEQSQMIELRARKIAETRSTELTKQVNILKSIFENLNPNREQLDDEDLRQRLGQRLIESAQLIADSSNDSNLQISLLDTLSNSLASIGQPQGALDVATAAVKVAESDNVARGDWLRAQVALAYAHSAVSQHLESRKILSQLKDEVLNSPAFKNDEKTMMLMMLGQQWFVTAYDYGVVDDYEKALDVYTELLAIADETSENEGVVASRLIARFRTAEITHIQGNSQIETLKEVIADSEKRLGKKHPFTISFLNHFAQSLTWSKDFELAKKYSEISYQRCRKKFGDKSPRTLEALDALIIACGRTINSPNSKDRLQNILPLAEELCEEIIQREGFVNSAIGIRFGNIATGWGLTGDIKRCIEIKRKILDAATHSNGRNHSVAQIQVMGLAVSLCAAGQLIEAEELLHEFIAYVEDRSDSDQEPWRSRLQNAKQQLMLIKIQKTIPDEKEKLRNR